MEKLKHKDPSSNMTFFQNTSYSHAKYKQQTLKNLCAESQTNDLLINPQSSEERVPGTTRSKLDHLLRKSLISTEREKAEPSALNNGSIDIYTSSHRTQPLTTTHYTTTTSLMNDKWIRTKKTPRGSSNLRYSTPQRQKEIGFAIQQAMESKQKPTISKIPVPETEPTQASMKQIELDTSPSEFENRLSTENESSARKTFLMKIGPEIDKLFVERVNYPTQLVFTYNKIYFVLAHRVFGFFLF